MALNKTFECFSGQTEAAKQGMIKKKTTKKLQRFKWENENYTYK